MQKKHKEKQDKMKKCEDKHEETKSAPERSPSMARSLDRLNNNSVEQTKIKSTEEIKNEKRNKSEEQKQR